MAGWDDLSAGQRSAVFHQDGPAAVFAGPGSGKTRVVTLRAARLAQQGNRLLVTTFTSDATEEMRQRISMMLSADALANVRVTTLHAFCLNFLKTQKISFSLLTDEFQRKSLAEAAQAGEVEGGVSEFLYKLSYQKNTGTTAAAYKHDGSSDDMDFARCWRTYEKEKAKKGLLEFDDLILEVATLLEKHEEMRVAAASQYTHIIVDECQDMNYPQYRVVFALGRDHKNLMLVGDLDQSLYGFRGSDTQTFKRFAAQANVKPFELRENYRCTREILRFADSLIRQDADRRPIDFLPTRPVGEPVTWARYADPDIEALAVGDAVLRLHRSGLRWRDIAVLYRMNAQAEAIERHFAGLEIPYTIREDGDFYSRKEVQGMMAYMQFFSPAPKTKDDKRTDVKGTGVKAGKPSAGSEASAIGTDGKYADEWLLALMNVPNRKIGRNVGGQLKNMADIRGTNIWSILPDFHADDIRTHRAIKSLIQDLHRIDKRLPTALHAGEAIHIIRTGADIDGWLRRDAGADSDNDRLQNIQRMQSAAAHYATVREYLDAVQKVRDEAARRKSERQKKRREQDEVCLSTGHAAKGLEWGAVFAIGWSEEILPHRKAEDINEERRIAYVIATRARDLLRISSLESWNDAITSPTRFLTGLNLAASEVPPCDADGENLSIERTARAPTDELTPMGGLFMD